MYLTTREFVKLRELEDKTNTKFIDIGYDINDIMLVIVDKNTFLNVINKLEEPLEHLNDVVKSVKESDGEKVIFKY